MTVAASFCDEEIADGLTAYTTAFTAGLEPDPVMPIWAWADKNRFLPPDTNSEPGPYRTSRTPFWRQPLEDLSPTSSVDKIVIEKGAQVGASTAAENVVGFVMDTGAGPVLLVRPTESDAKKVSKQRIQPMIENTPSLRKKVKTQRSRESGNNILEKTFKGGFLSLVGANSPVGTRGVSVFMAIVDELDAMPLDVGGEGDIVALVNARTNSFRRKRKRLLLSTPTTTYDSRIHREYLETDQRRYFVSCFGCGTLNFLTWERIKWETDEDGTHHPETASYVCPECDYRHKEHDKPRLFAERGHGGLADWIPTAESKEPKTRGYHLSALYSPFGWFSWEDAARQFLKAKKNGRLELQTWTNLVLGDPFEETGEGMEPEALLARCEAYAAPCPKNIVLLTAGVDVQENRLEVEVVGHGGYNGTESWSIDHRIFYGNTEEEPVWDQLDQLWDTTYLHEDGGSMPIIAAAIDSGYATQVVYEYCRTRQARRIYCIKGKSGPGLPYAGPPRKTKTGKDPRPVDLYTLGVDGLKSLLFSRLRVAEPGPGYCHFPVSDKHNLEFFAQLTAERLVPAPVRGQMRKVWRAIRKRNEVLDCRNYANAAVFILDPVWDVLLRSRQAAAAAEETEAAPQEPVSRRKPRNFVNKFGRDRRR
jgi:phage terminase large subunit GpA-like protein